MIGLCKGSIILRGRELIQPFLWIKISNLSSENGFALLCFLCAVNGEFVEAATKQWQGISDC